MNTRKLVLPGLILTGLAVAALATPALAQQRDAQSGERDRTQSAPPGQDARKAGERAAQLQSGPAKAQKKDKARQAPERELEEEDER